MLARARQLLGLVLFVAFLNLLFDLFDRIELVLPVGDLACKLHLLHGHRFRVVLYPVRLLVNLALRLGVRAS